MVEAVMLWNEPNNLSHWDFKIDPEWKMFAEMAIMAAKAVRCINPELPIVLGGISPIDPHFIRLMASLGVLDAIDVVALQGFQFGDHRLDSGVEWLRRLKVRHLRTGVSWADRYRPNAEEWFDRQMGALEEFETTMTLCFTPEHLGIAPHYTSPPKDANTFAEFAEWAVRRYAAPRRAQAREEGSRPYAREAATR